MYFLLKNLELKAKEFKHFLIIVHFYLTNSVSKIVLASRDDKVEKLYVIVVFEVKNLVLKYRDDQFCD